MQVHYYVREDIVVDGVGDINFVIVFVVVKIDYHLMNDGLSTAMSTSRVVGNLSSVSVFTTFTSMNTMNNVLPIFVFANEENVFIHLPKLVDLQLILKTHFGTCSKKSCPSMVGWMPSFHNHCFILST
jgi:hypothetical protein